MLVLAQIDSTRQIDDVYLMDSPLPDLSANRVWVFRTHDFRGDVRTTHVWPVDLDVREVGESDQGVVILTPVRMRRKFLPPMLRIGETHRTEAVEVVPTTITKLGLDARYYTECGALFWTTTPEPLEGDLD